MHGSGADAVLRYEVLDTAPELHFDDIVALAAQICAAPTAIVSLLDGDRQWFKARLGFEPHQTGLDRSICKHVVREARTIIIPDLTEDDRTRHNPLVTGDPRVRFYAGAPLATRDGIVGALCVLDTKPRPQGLSPDQAAGLERLARQVMMLLEMRRDALDLRRASVERDRFEAAQQLSERRWRELYRGMNQGFIYARVVRDAAGAIHDWRYEEVNDAWGELVGIPPAEARGRTIRQLIPGIEDAWVMEFAQVVEKREPVHFTRQVGVFDRWYDGMAQWVGGDDFTVIFSEVTARVHEERRRDALLALGDILRDDIGADAMTTEASRVVGEAVDASRATFGDMDHSRERVSVTAGWAVPGMPGIAGSYRFSDYGRVRDYLLRGDVLAIDDVVTDPRTADDAKGWHDLRARAVVNVPVRERGRTTAILIVHKTEPHRWTEGELAFLRNAADRIEIANARKRDAEQQDLVNGEIAHRLKNALAMVQAVASQTLRSDASDAGLEGFTHRLQALGKAHDALTASHWRAATLEAVVAGVLDLAGVRDRCTVAGPAVALGSRAALSTSLLVHELAVNALKYGALSGERGRVAIRWRCDGEGDGCELALTWTEEGGPPPIAPTRRGFGSRLIRLGLVGTGGSDLRYDQAGLNACFRAPLAQVEQA